MTRRKPLTLLAALAAITALVLAPIMARAGVTPSAGVPHWNTAVCGHDYVPIDLGHGDYFNVNNEPEGNSCISAERHVLSWYVTRQPGTSLWGYPNISSGIEWGKYTCYDGRSASPSSPGSRCMRYPVQEKNDGHPLTSASVWPHLIDGNVSYDIWFNKTYVKPSDVQQDDGAEVMVWLDHPGVTIRQASVCWHATIQGRAYNVMCWTADHNGKTWNYIAYVAVRQTRSLPPTWLNMIFRNAIAHGKLSPDWWLTAIDFGSEINQADGGFAVKSYSLVGVR